MSIALDYSDVQQGSGLIPEGDYEVIIQSAYEECNQRRHPVYQYTAYCT